MTYRIVLVGPETKPGSTVDKTWTYEVPKARFDEVKDFARAVFDDHSYDRVERTKDTVTFMSTQTVDMYWLAEIIPS